MDGNQNYLFDSKTETVAFSDSIIVPSMMPATRQDTIWKDTLTIDTIKTVGYTRFLPDNVILRAFKEENTRQFFLHSKNLIAFRVIIPYCCCVDIKEFCLIEFCFMEC